MLFNFLIFLSSVCVAHRYGPRRRVGPGFLRSICCVLLTAPKTRRRPFVILPSSLFLSTCLLLRYGDIHPNPGPDTSTNNLDTSSLLSSYSDLINSELSVVHLNIQSLRTKLDLIQIELQHYDVLIFSETWLSPDISNANLKLTIFSTIQIGRALCRERV